ncbi:hypothetical protein CHLRE_17g730350v5 [Chlamydomonas reinhardtii]|uniref:Uncharacterized protein n=1 Tax=Chlamydomonas reinhardtii TaxID=3055 RepID=A0A2K3CQZ7_CHLRE|nr:uncharacterized protein CHLRE_17g730350v5 [Chlamydomonas reinhardtii]PNW70685.1 hypothetical protein CHLRE_17g730350v5 [Chlamydomonas reinhardtii]
MLLRLRSAGSPVGGDMDPLLHLDWNDAAFHEAATGGPFEDAVGQSDARTVDSVEQVLAAHGGVRISRGLFKFETGNALHLALARTRDQLPWLRRGHQAHASSGDVASSCIYVNVVHGKFAFEHLPYFSMT